MWQPLLKVLKRNKVLALIAVDETKNYKYVNNMFQLVLKWKKKKVGKKTNCWECYFISADGRRPLCWSDIGPDTWMKWGSQLYKYEVE